MEFYQRTIDVILYFIPACYCHGNVLLGPSEEGSTHSYVSLSDLTSYVQQLRSFLPKATVMLRRELLGTDPMEGEGSGLFEEDLNEDYVTEFLSQDLVADWNKLSPKVIAIYM